MVGVMQLAPAIRRQHSPALWHPISLCYEGRIKMKKEGKMEKKMEVIQGKIIPSWIELAASEIASWHCE